MFITGAISASANISSASVVFDKREISQIYCLDDKSKIRLTSPLPLISPGSRGSRVDVADALEASSSDGGFDQEESSGSSLSSPMIPSNRIFDTRSSNSGSTSTVFKVPQQPFSANLSSNNLHSIKRKSKPPSLKIDADFQHSASCVSVSTSGATGSGVYQSWLKSPRYAFTESA